VFTEYKSLGTKFGSEPTRSHDY